MKLEFSLLVVDDQPENINQAIQDLEEHLETKGFSLKKEVVMKPTETTYPRVGAVKREKLRFGHG